VDLGYKKHYRVNHVKDEFANSKSHINGIENFWGIAKMRLSKFRGLNKQTFYLHLKETEFRFNHRNQNLYKLILNMLQNESLKLS
jgi:transposase